MSYPGHHSCVLERIQVRLKHMASLREVVVGLVPATLVIFAPCLETWDRWDKPGDDVRDAFNLIEICSG